MNLELFAGVVCAFIFFRAADYERLNPWVWSVASVGLTGIAILLRQGLAVSLVAQAGLFGAMWWYHLRLMRHRMRDYTGG